MDIEPHPLNETELSKQLSCPSSPSLSTTDEYGKTQSVSNEESSTRPFSKEPLFWTALITMNVVGGLNPLVSKMGVLQYSYPCSPSEDCSTELFDGFMSTSYLKYFWQTILAAFIYKIVDQKFLEKPFFMNEEDYTLSKTYNWKVYRFFYMTSLLDTGFTICERAATVYTRASIVSALSAVQIIVTCLTDLIITKRALMVGEVIGLLLVLGGVLTYALGNLSSESADDSQSLNPGLGLTLALCSSVCRGIHATVQGKYMRRYKLPPMKALCIESGFCQINMWVLIGIFQLTKFTDVKREFWMVVRNWKVMLSVQGFGFLCIGFNGSAAVVGKFVTGLFRMVLMRLAGLLTWIAEMSIGWTSFQVTNLIGWIIIMLGTATFAAALPKIKTKNWFFRPFICRIFVPPPQAVLTAKQEEKRERRHIGEVA